MENFNNNFNNIFNNDFFRNRNNHANNQQNNSNQSSDFFQNNNSANQGYGSNSNQYHNRNSNGYSIWDPSKLDPSYIKDMTNQIINCVQSINQNNSGEKLTKCGNLMSELFAPNSNPNPNPNPNQNMNANANQSSNQNANANQSSNQNGNTNPNQSQNLNPNPNSNLGQPNNNEADSINLNSQNREDIPLQQVVNEGVSSQQSTRPVVRENEGSIYRSLEQQLSEDYLVDSRTDYHRLIEDNDSSQCCSTPLSHPNSWIKYSSRFVVFSAITTTIYLIYLVLDREYGRNASSLLASNQTKTNVSNNNYWLEQQSNTNNITKKNDSYADKSYEYRQYELATGWIRDNVYNYKIWAFNNFTGPAPDVVINSYLTKDNINYDVCVILKKLLTQLITNINNQLQQNIPIEQIKTNSNSYSVKLINKTRLQKIQRTNMAKLLRIKKSYKSQQITKKV
jgi:hypothetical protein